MRRGIGITLLAAGLLSCSIAVPAQAADPIEYVALGDSYSAGFGLSPLAPVEPALGCYQALNNYPKIVAAALGYSLTDRTCSGAVTANIRDLPQLTITRQGTAPVQSDYLSASTDVVTVTIGGNDLTFSSVAQECVFLTATGRTFTGFPTCKEFYEPVPEVDRLTYLLDHTVRPALKSTFDLIRAKAPNARIFVVGYPVISPDAANIPAGGCYTDPLGNGAPPFPQNTFPYTTVDTEYLHDIEGRLDSAIREEAANRSGFTFISTWAATQTHSACATDRYVNGISLTTSSANSQPIPDTPYYVELGALHPNATGVAFLAAQVQQAISDRFAAEEREAAAAAAKPRLAATGAEPIALVPGLLLLAAGGILVALRRRTAS